MISSKFILPPVFLGLLLCLNVRAQSHSTQEIDAMLFSARSTLTTYPEQTIELSEKIHKLSVENNYAQGEDDSLLLLYIGCLNSYKYDFVIKNLYKLEESARKHENYQVLANTKLIKACVLSKIQYYKRSVEEAQNTFPLVQKIDSKNSKNIYNGLTYQTLGFLKQTQAESRDSVLYYLLLAKNEFEKVQDFETDGFTMYTRDDLLYNNYASLANEFMAQNVGFDSVDYYLNKALKLNPKYENSTSKAVILNNIGCSLLHKKKFNGAIQNYNVSVDISKKYNNKETLIAAYDGLSIVYQEMKDYKNASKYGNLMKLLQAEFIDSNKNMISSSVDNVFSQNESTFKKTNNNLSRIIILIAILTFLCLYVAFLFHKKFKDEKLTKKEIESLLEEKIAQISNSIEENEVILKKVDIEKIVNLAMYDEATFYVNFNEAFPDFKKKLTDLAPTLVASELKFAAYLKLDFSAKEIAIYTNSSVRAVEAKKYRLRKKLNISSEIDTNVWFSRI